ncbi:unnamed protein product [Auanema sp. JU1783]|nr:unnamed protein product [Auanema sp. JU1783]
MSAEAAVTETPVAQTEQPKEEQTTEAKKVFTEGKDFYLAGTYDQASEKLREALKLGVEAFGEFGVENFDTYYYYGKALLKKEVAKPTETTEENKAQEETNEAAADSTESKTPYVLALEAFEAAQKIVEAQEDKKDWELRAAKVVFATGEVYDKEDNFAKASTFYAQALELFNALIESASSEVVETQIALANAYKNTKEFTKAQELYTKAKETITARAEITDEEKAKNLKEVEELEKKIAELELEIQQSAPEVVQADENTTEVVNEVTEKIENDSIARQGVKRNAEITPTDESKRLKEINNE